MSSVAAAQGMIRDIGGLVAPDLPVKIKIDRVYRELRQHLPTISRRRVRAFFFGEAARVDYDEMRALNEVRAEQELRRARRQFAASAVILASHYAEIGSTVDRDAMLEVGRRHGAMDLPRNGGEAR